ncbi:hypothetical protein PIB30_102911 [Stylosanthes scabra]|uniref:Uncharacterized protein n=1 Tax=Stylosanthes scabra TaxID=79078 RepID=A0ABU6ZWE3_9FABA|nr:hypothetical protein [Stylosanthes scabra]
MSTRRERSRIPRATRSSSPTDSTISSATSRPKRQRDHPHGDGYSDGPCPRTPCMRATAYHRLFAHGASSQGVVYQIDRVLPVPVLPVRTHGSPSRMLRSGGTKEDAVEALPPLDVSILPSDEQTTQASTPTVDILDIPGSTVPRMSSVSSPEGPAEIESFPHFVVLLRVRYFIRSLSASLGAVRMSQASELRKFMEKSPKINPQKVKNQCTTLLDLLIDLRFSRVL